MNAYNCGCGGAWWKKKGKVVPFICEKYKDDGSTLYCSSCGHLPECHAMSKSQFKRIKIQRGASHEG